MKRDPEKHRDWQRRGAENYRDRVKREVLKGERPWNSIPPINPDRRKAEVERAYGPPERRAWVKGLPSVVSGCGPCENAHVPPPGDLSGMGRKADFVWVVPLTRGEHRELHQIGVESFQRKHGINLYLEAGKIEGLWQERQG